MVEVKKDTRLHIIETASRLFYEKGYNLIGINEVIAESGIAKSTLYSHFRSKEELCNAYLDQRNDNFMRDLEAFCQSKPEGKDRVMAVLEFLVPFYKSREFNGCWCVRTVAEIPKENKTIRDKIRTQKNELRDFIKKLIGRNMSKLSAKEKEKLANRVYLLYEGAVSESHLHGKPWPIEENISLLRELL